ncbi:MAG: hypothetical protein PWQ67_1197 [Clostridia bacterium]|jgi:hypothetical protein|nr:hypothetical protein [Clostridia bacterium]MDN5322743.1 hypothetical protein [Clostridia bacterium]
MGKIFLGLVHFPVYNKNMEIISTSITNMDIHDIARTVTTYGVETYYIINPLQTQHEITSEILKYWQEGYGGQYNPHRKIALEKVVLAKSIEETIEDIKLKYFTNVKTIVTDARKYPNSINYLDLRNEISETVNVSYLLLFGTGWGLAKEVMEKADYRLLPIFGVSEYNHLSVRSAVAIILDRLNGEKWW